jgi:hypothetical protein
MDKSKIVNKVAVPKVIPIRLSILDKMRQAKKTADEHRRKQKMIQDIKWDRARHR